MAAEELWPIGDSTRQRLRDYLDVAWRRKFLFLVPTVCGGALTLVVVLTLPQIYRSSATILVESPQVPENFVSTQPRAGGYASNRIQLIRQRILTQANLLSIIGKYGLYGETGQTSGGSSDLEERMLNALDIQSISSVAEKGRQSSSTIAIAVAFEHTDPHTAQNVTRELVARFLEENTRAQSASVVETKQFITTETDRLNAQLVQLEAEVAAFRQKHNDLLPERAAMYARRAEELGDAQRDLDASMRTLQASRIAVASQLAAFTKKNTGDDVLLTQVRDTRALLREARAKYTNSHPEVKRLERQLASLTAGLNAQPGRETRQQQNAEQGADPLYAQLQLQLDGVDRQIDLLERQKATVQGEIQKLRQLSAQIPGVEKGLMALQRQYEDVQARFQQLTAKEMQAQLTEKLESEEMTERLTLIEPPSLPDRPIKPNRRLLAVVGLGLAMIVSAALVVFAELMDNGIRTRRQLRPYFSAKVPIVAIPYVADARDRMWGTLKAASIALILAAAILAAGFSVHTRYRPLANLGGAELHQVGSKATHAGLP